MRKRLLSALLCAVLLAGMIPAAHASDLSGHWAKEYIEYLDREGVINPSQTTGKYEPDRAMTRAEFMRYINRAFHFTEMTAISYTDVSKNAWYYDTVRIAVKYGYINGVAANRMDPQGKVTREQAAVIIGRLFKADPGNVTAADLPFTDKGAVSSWAAAYIKAAADKGILGGYSDGTFKPQRVVTRGEVAKILYYYMGTSLSTAGKAYTAADLKTDTQNVTISESCTLSDVTVPGDLYITEGVGSDAVTLTNVIVEGSLIVSGGTVTMINTTSDHVIVSSPMGRLLQVTATGAAHIGEVEVQTAAALYEKSLSGAEERGFTNILVNGNSRVSLTVDAAVDEMVLVGEATVSMTAKSSVYRMEARKAASVTGYGTVYRAEIRAPGVSFASSVTVSGYTLADGITATIGGQTVSTSSEAGVSPDCIAVDHDKSETVGSGAEITVPADVSVTSVSCNGRTLSERIDYTKTQKGVRVQAAYLNSLPVGEHRLMLRLSNGAQVSVVIKVSGGAEQQHVPQAVFDRYYQASGFADVRLRPEGVSRKEDIQSVVLGLSKIDFSFDRTAGALILRRGVLAQLRAGTYTISVDLQNGSRQAFDLRVTDSTPENTSATVAEYNTFSPVEPRLPLPLDKWTVRSVTAMKNGSVQTLAAGMDYMLQSRSLMLTKAALERFRRADGYVEFLVTLSDNSVHTLVVDYI